MKHSDLKVGMKVRRVANFSNSNHTSSEGSISTVQNIYRDYFSTVEEKDEDTCWEAEYFEPVEEIKEEPQMQKITMDKKYRTRCGYPVRVLCVDMKDEKYPVVALIEEVYGESPFCLTTYGKTYTEQDDEYDLIEVSSYEDFKKDDKVMVSEDGENWYKRYFAYEKDGVAYAFYDGSDSWSGEDVHPWEYCRKPTQEELEE